MLSAAAAKAAAPTPATSATPAPTAAPVPITTPAASTLSVVPVQPEVLMAIVQPAEMSMLATEAVAVAVAVANQEMMERLVSTIPAAPVFPAGHPLPPGPALCRLDGDSCNR